MHKSQDHEEIFDAIKFEVISLNLHWKYLSGVLLDEPGQRKWEILSSTAPIFFDLTLHLFYDHILLKSAKLVDPDKTRNDENLSIANLLLKMPTISCEAWSKVNATFDLLKSNISSIKVHRNKRIAHNDLQTALKTQSLPQIQESEFIAVVQGFNDLLNLIQKELRGYTTNFDSEVQPIDEPENFIALLKSARTL